jgi:hypothetical protein
LPTNEETNSEFRAASIILRGVVLGEDAALLQDGDPVAHLYRLVYVVGDEDDGFLDLPLDAQKLVLQAVARDGVHRPERLVHKHDRGIGRHRPCDAHPLLLAAGELGRVAVPVLLGIEAHQLQKLVHPGRYAVLLPLQKLRDGGNVGGDGAVGEESYLLYGVPDVAPEPRPAHGGVRLAVYQDLTARRLY